MFPPLFKSACRSQVGYTIRAPITRYLPAASRASCPTTPCGFRSQNLSRTCARISSTSVPDPGSRHGQISILTLVFFSIGGVVGLDFWYHHQLSKTFNDAPPPVFGALDQPVEIEDSIIWKGMVHPYLDLAAANTKLRAEETSTKFKTTRETNATRFDSIRVASNNPSEDEKSYSVANVGEAEDWKFWGVYDGHAGWATAQVLRGYLTNYVVQALRQAKHTALVLTPQAIDNAIKLGFLNLDNEITSDGIDALTDFATHAEAVSRIAPARAGSCALLAAFDPNSATLRVACTGDSRAVLGRRVAGASSSSSSQEPNSQAQYTTEALSEDQTGFNERERERIAKAHPDEPDAIEIKSGRLLGLAVTRAFGDHRWKWPLDAITKCKSNFYGTSARPNYISPPYLTAEPEVTTTKVAKGDFLILATDGLWDHMSSEDAVKCVSQWIEREQGQGQNRTRQTVSSSIQPSVTDNPELAASSTDQKEAESQFNYWYKATPEHFVVEDENVATHLVRNALGGSRRELFCSVMTTQAPDSRNVRDDVTVQVILFGDVLGGRR